MLRESGLGLIGQTPEIAPADRKLYALRDVTGTVESLPLIAASIMSKKMAEGIDALVLDVKTGDGAFMTSYEDSRALAETMVAIGRGMGKKVAALITDMDQPLGRTVGNALEIVECIETLQGRGPRTSRRSRSSWRPGCSRWRAPRRSLDAARAQVRDALASGAGLRKFQQIIELQGGDPRCATTRRACRGRARRSSCAPSPTAASPPSPAARSATRPCCWARGARPWTAGSTPAVGLVLHKKVGDLVIGGEPLLTVHVNDRGRLDEALAMLRRAIRVGPEARPPRPGPRVIT